jgi:hypothetical protein
MPERIHDDEETELLMRNAGSPASVEDAHGAGFMSTTIYRDKEIDSKFEEFKKNHPWVAELDNLGRKAKAYATANGTQIRTGAVVVSSLLVTGAVVNEVVKIHKKKKRNNPPKA